MKMTKKMKSSLLVLVALAALGVAVSGASAGEYTGHPTTVTLKCEPEGPVGATRTCTVTVIDVSGEPSPPTGKVAFAGVEDSAPAECTLVAAAANSSACQALVTPQAAGTYKFNVIYAGDEIRQTGATEVTLVAGSPSSTPVSNSSLTWAAAPSSGTPASESEAPTLKLGVKPAKKTRAHLAKFTFTTETAGARFECRLGKGKYKPCTSPYKHKVGTGSQTFSVRVITSTGIFGAGATEYGWKVLGPKK
jgi:hypothetical protein